MHVPSTVEKWGLFEAAFEGKTAGNPFCDYTIHATFTGKSESVRVAGFYDGEGGYKVRFMPSFEGDYHYTVEGSFSDTRYEGQFTVTAPTEGNHGPVKVANTYHFAYADGTPYYSIGTTCYVWELQSDELIAQTLASLQQAGFNKIRFCLWPKHYDYNLGEPRSYPYEGTPMDSRVLTKENFQQYTGRTEGNHWDFMRPNPRHFQHIESCILALQRIGVQADLIVMHPYDRWGFSQMTREQDDLYWNYVIARLAAYRNVWWSLANEYDLLEHKTLADWEHYAQLLCENDPYCRLRSIHNCHPFYDYTRPWVTHCSIQRQDLYKTAELVDQWRLRFGKPVVVDEMVYEGNIQHGWGNISGEEMLRRFWEAACRGGYPGHGETYRSDDGVLWWSHGGKLRGESWKRFGLLHEILCQTPGLGLTHKAMRFDDICAVPEDPALAQKTGYHLFYYSFMRPSFREFYFDDQTPYRVRVIDTWNATVEDAGIHKGRFTIELPGRPYMAIQLQKAL